MHHGMGQIQAISPHVVEFVLDRLGLAPLGNQFGQ